MNNKLIKFQIISIVFTILLGTLLHFTYNLSNNNIIVGIFSAINESTWEHLKILFFPMLTITIIGSLYFKNTYPNYLCIKTKSILIAMSFITIFFYTYTGIIGTSYSTLNIIIFIISIIISEYYTYNKLINSNYTCNNTLSIIILIVLSILFIIFTFYPPKINLFKEPIANTYGQ